MQYQFPNAKIDWLTWWCSSRFTRYCTLNSSYCKKRHIFCLIVLQTLISLIKSTWLAFKICWRRVTRNFLMHAFCLWPATLWKRRRWHRCFPVSFSKVLRNLFYKTPPSDCFYASVFIFFLNNEELVYFFFRV